MKNYLRALAILSLLLPFARPLERLALSQSPGGLVMVANNGNAAAASMTPATARKLLLGEMTEWPGKAKVVIALPPSGSPQREAILKKLCGLTETVFIRRQMQAAFTGETAASIHDAPTAAAVKSFVKSNPGAVGFLRRSEADDSVKVVLEVE